MAHTCTPQRWGAPAGTATGGTRGHALAAVGTLYGFAESQLMAAQLTAFQVLLRLKPGIAVAIVERRRFPAWTQVAEGHAECAVALVQALHCRRLVEALTGRERRTTRAILCLAGWSLLASELQWRRPLPDSPEPTAHVHAGAQFGRWVHALLGEAPAGPAPADDERDIRELAATGFRHWDVPGPLLAGCTVHGLAAGEGPDSLQLVDALAGEPGAWAQVAAAARQASGGPPWAAAELRPLLVAALNPPLCVSLLGADDAVPGWSGLQPGLRFLRLCRSFAEGAARPVAGATAAEQLAQVDALCVRCGGPALSAQLQRAEQARHQVQAVAGLADVARWLADHWNPRAGARPRVPPGTYACTRYLAFLDAFVLTQGGLAGHAVDADLASFACDPTAVAAAGPLPLAWQAALLHAAAIDIVGGLMQGASLDKAAARARPVLDPWPDIADSLAPVLRLPTLDRMD